MPQDPLLVTLLDLDAVLNPEPKLTIGGGYGLFLKQLYLNSNPQIRTLFSTDALPTARTTQDIDLILRAEIVTDSGSMKKIRDALDQLGFTVKEGAEYTQFTRPMPAGEVKIDLLASPLGDLVAKVKRDVRRVRPKPSVNLHASKLEEALGVDRHAIPIPIQGELSSGKPHQTEVLIPQAFSYLLMKLCAFDDCKNQEKKSLGQHHALDAYRIVGLLTEDEDAAVKELAGEFNGHPVLTRAREIVTAHFVSSDGIGQLRIREHPLYTERFNLDQFAQEIQHLIRTAEA